MTLTENFIQNAIHIDAGAEVMYGSDQMNDTYPVRFATVEFQLMATDALVEVADRMLWSVVTLFGWLLGGPVGIGTLLSTFGAGAVMHLFYSMIHFEPRKLQYKSLTETVKLLSGKQPF